MDRAVVVAKVEVLEVEQLDRFAPPQPEGVAGVDAVAEHRGVIRHALDPHGRDPADPVSPRLVGVAFGMAAEADVEAVVRTRDLPGIALLQPLVGDLDLGAVADLLVEDAELVAEAVADRRHLKRRKRVEVAGGKAAEAAVPEPWFLLDR